MMNSMLRDQDVWDGRRRTLFFRGYLDGNALFLTKVRRALAAAVRLARGQPASLGWVYFRVSLIAWIGFGLGLWCWMAVLPPTAIGAAIALGQASIIYLVAARLWQRSSEVLWYQHRRRPGTNQP